MTSGKLTVDWSRFMFRSRIYTCVMIVYLMVGKGEKDLDLPNIDMFTAEMEIT